MMLCSGLLGDEPRPRTEPLIVAGIDDWGVSQGHRYGTFVCDLARRRFVTLLPDREIAAVRLGFRPSGDQGHSRDRGGGYGKAAAKAVPGAVPWHLMENAGAASPRHSRKLVRQVSRGESTESSGHGKAPSMPTYPYPPGGGRLV